MADISLPPVPPPPVPPPLTPLTSPGSSNSPLDIEDEEDAALAELSPFKVLQKRGMSELPVPPAAPTAPAPLASMTPQPMTPQPSTPSTGQSATPPIDREALLKHAAQVPQESFILPSLKQIKDAKPVQSIPPVNLAEKTDAPLVGEKPNFTRGGRSTDDVGIKPEEASLNKLTSMRTLPFGKGKAPKAAPLFPKPARKVGISGGMALIGGLLALVVLAGALYVLALGGARVPLLYEKISGLNPSATTLASSVLTDLKGQSSYQVQGEITIEPLGDDGVTVTLPESDTVPEGVVYQLSSKISKAQFMTEGKIFAGKMEVTANNTQPIPLVIRTERGTVPTWSAIFPANSSRDLVKTDGLEVSSTLLYPVLSPVSADGLLQAVANEQAYSKKEVTGSGARAVAVYNVSYNAANIKDFFPSGATLAGPKGSMAIYWKDENNGAGLPQGMTMDTSMTYLGKKYHITASFSYGNYGQSLLNTSPGGDLENVITTAPATIGEELTAEDFILRLGISFAGLPHAAPETTEPATLPDPNATPTPSPTSTPTATPTPSPSPSPSASAAITPTGKTISAIMAAVPGHPMVPIQPASAAAKVRDAQRKLDLKDLQTALNNYHAANGRYPVGSGVDGIQVASNQAFFGSLVTTYLTAMPVDPVSQVYYYSYTSDGASGYTLRCILEDASDAQARQGSVYAYYQLTN